MLLFSDDTFLFLPPSRYIFKGADYLQDVDDVFQDTDSESSMESDASYSQGLLSPQHTPVFSRIKCPQIREEQIGVPDERDSLTRELGV